MQEISRSQPAVNRAEGDHIPWGWVALTVVGLEIALVLSACRLGCDLQLFDQSRSRLCLTTKTTPSSPVRLCQLLLAFHISSLRVAGLDVKRTRAVAASLSVYLIIFIIDVLLISVVGGLNAYHRGSGGAFTCDENAGRVLRRQGRVERCDQDPGSCR